MGGIDLIFASIIGMSLVIIASTSFFQGAAAAWSNLCQSDEVPVMGSDYLW